MADSETSPESGAAMPLPPGLRLLKFLVMALMITMILGLITIVGLLVTRLPGPGDRLPELPAGIELPEGVKAGAVTFGQGWVGVVTKAGDELLIYDAGSGELRDRMAIKPAE